MVDLGCTVAESGNTLVDGRPREHNGNSTEFKFVFNRILESWHEPQISSLSCQNFQDENRYHRTECCRVLADPDGMWLGQEQEQGARDRERQEKRKGQ